MADNPSINKIDNEELWLIIFHDNTISATNMKK